MENVPKDAVHIFDAMPLLQSLTNIPETFSELATLLFNTITMGQSESRQRVDFVADQYPAISIKNVERTRRSSKGTILVNITHGSQKCPRQWKKFLGDGRNKENLIEFLFKQWSGARFAHRLTYVDLFVTHVVQEPTHVYSCF